MTEEILENGETVQQEQIQYFIDNQSEYVPEE